MKIKRVEFAGAIARPGVAAPLALAQVAFAGRSNVGKSSLINRLLGRTRTQMARVSATPGKTQEINFYSVVAAVSTGAERAFLLVDLPGYGYARAPLAVRDRWRPLIESYLSSSELLRGVVQLMDARHDPTAADLQMAGYLGSLGVPTLIIVTKVDKLKPSAKISQVDRITAALGIEADQVIPFSSRTGEGREVVLEAMETLLTEEPV